MTEWRIHVSNDDITAALQAWEQATARRDEPLRLAQLWSDVERLCRTQAWQTMHLLELAAR